MTGDLIERMQKWLDDPRSAFTMNPDEAKELISLIAPSAKPEYGTLDWLIMRLYHNRLTGKEILRLNTTGSRNASILSFYIAKEGELDIDIGDAESPKQSDEAKKPCCKNCKFAGREEAYSEIPCQRHAPIAHKVDHTHSIRIHIPAWPVMRHGDWCGDFQPK